MYSYCVPVTVLYPLAFGEARLLLTLFIYQPISNFLGDWGRVLNTATIGGQTDRNLGLGI